MTTFLVFTEDDKQGTLYPKVIGPFDSQAEAAAFVFRHPRAIDEDTVEPSDGGYAGVVYVNADAATNPADQAGEWEEDFGRWDEVHGEYVATA